MKNKLTGVVLLVVGSVAGCVLLATQVDKAYQLAWYLAQPTVQVLVNATTPRWY